MATETENRLKDDESKPGDRLLALEIRSRKFGFAVLQGAELLDWGVRSFPGGLVGIEAAIGRLAFILKLYSPSVAIARRTRRVKDRSSMSASRVLRKFRGALKQRSIPLLVLPRRDVHNALGCRTKQEIFAVVAHRLGQLKSKLPRARKPWEPERNIVAVFDAVATALAFRMLRESADNP